MQNVITVLVCWLLCELCCLIHELGHAIGHRIGGGRAPWIILVGSGPLLLKVGRFRFSLIPAGGFYCPESEDVSAKEQLLMLAGGPLTSLLLTLVFGVLRFGVFQGAAVEPDLMDFRYLSAFVFMCNLSQFFFTAVPMRYHVVCCGHDSDGKKILTLLRRNR